MSTIQTLEIPKWGLSMQEGKITKWSVKEGDLFKKGDEICVIETSKIANSLEATFDSVLRKILAQSGSTLKVGSIIAICADKDISDEEIEQFIQSLNVQQFDKPNKEIPKSNEIELPKTVTSKTSIQPQVSVANNSYKDKAFITQTISIPSSLQGYQEQKALFTTPHAQKLAKKYNVNLDKIIGTGPQKRISLKDIQLAVIANGGKWPEIQSQANVKQIKSIEDDSHVLATPLARRVAKKWNINLHDCRASGSRGRVCKADVEAVYYRDANNISKNDGLEDAKQPTIIPMDGMRQTIAQRLQAAKSEIPHFYLTIDFNVELLQKLRAEINNTHPEVKLSINDMFLKVVARALVAVPEVNVQYDEENKQIIQFNQADISVAVAIPGGLITPIVKAADQKSLSEISTTVRDLVTRAKTGKLAMDEFQGGSFCISNLGMYGIKQFEAIVNPPQGAILALGVSEKRAVVINDEIVMRHMVTATLSCDHRVIDGATGAKFLASLKGFVENPALCLV
ncbi:2-oxo acid dehydrogenase subunit E2 [Commensalibacter oyaizuii]|uniref:Dihydrolipoamide acetyltransferase component of pyruvate dehydrogenase complex n=1 Tax=Commensalibacter oyaizuii TaxID=3043873 RepID=A0ABT6PZB7_9PROT|nr:2-oxo acid dehydrogenase subunit E2 [Commensalibacter sp. TBRC 16381]MDI2090159.1 2-oxo acid dehydrogenase subunit E2 [Commensalibacter sp. TBRC 16381]